MDATVERTARVEVRSWGRTLVRTRRNSAPLRVGDNSALDWRVEVYRLRS